MVRLPKSPVLFANGEVLGCTLFDTQSGAVLRSSLAAVVINFSKQ